MNFKIAIENQFGFSIAIFLYLFIKFLSVLKNEKKGINLERKER